MLPVHVPENPGSIGNRSRIAGMLQPLDARCSSGIEVSGDGGGEGVGQAPKGRVLRGSLIRGGSAYRVMHRLSPTGETHKGDEAQATTDRVHSTLRLPSVK